MRQVPNAVLVLVSAACGVGAGTVLITSLSFLVVGGDVADLPPSLNLAAHVDWLAICAIPVAVICVASAADFGPSGARPAEPLPKPDWATPTPSIVEEEPVAAAAVAVAPVRRLPIRREPAAQGHDMARAA